MGLATRAGAEVLEPRELVMFSVVVALCVGVVLLALWVVGATIGWLLRGAKGPVLRLRGLKVIGILVVLCSVGSIGMILLLGIGTRVGLDGESRVIGDTRSVLSAQEGYARLNAGFYEGDLACLANPERCLPGYARSSGIFLDPRDAAAEVNRKGYRRLFHPGPPAEPGAASSKKCSRSSVRSFAYTAVPSNHARTGGRGFCGDSAGLICATSDGSPPRVVEGACVVTPPEKDPSDAKACRPLPLP
jgi:hypothetical protein